MSTTHLDRKELKRPDAFLKQANTLVDSVQHHTKLIIGVVAGLLVLGIAGALYNKNQSGKNEKANSAYFSAKSAFTTEYEKLAKTDNNALMTLLPMVNQIEKVAQDNPKTLAAYEASIFLGQTFLKKNLNDKALKYFEQALQNAPNRNLKMMALHAQSYAYENLNQSDKAIENLKQVISSQEKLLRSDALLALARNLKAKGENLKAIETLDLVLKEFPQSPVAHKAETLKAIITK